MSSVLHRNLKSSLPVAVRGEGIFVFDDSGKRYIDASGGAAVSCLGHSYPSVIAAIRDQVGKLPFAHTSFFTNQPSEQLADYMIARAPAGFGAGRVAFCGSGSEAMEIALKLARQYHLERGDTARSHFISRIGSYHGNTLGALSVGGHAKRRAPYAPMLMQTSQIEPCHAYRYQRDDETLEQYGLRAANTLEAEIRRIGPEKVAAFVVEPIGGATMGCLMPVPGYFRRIREICDQYGVLLITDEVMCGMGRTGDLFVSQAEGITPDIITVAKGLGAGYQPIGAVLAAQKVVAALENGSGALANGHTYMSHAVACAGALAVLRAIESDGLLDNVRTLGAELERQLRKTFGDHPNIGDIRGRGLFWTIELVVNRNTKMPFAKELKLGDKLKAKAQAHGLICYPSTGTMDGDAGDHLLLAPPFICSKDDIAEIVRLAALSINELLAESRA